MTKINKAILRKLRKQGKKREEIAEHFKCSISAIAKAITDIGAQRMASTAIKKRVKTRIQTKIFNEVEIYRVTAQGMINEVEKTISDNSAINNYVKQIIKNSEGRNLNKREKELIEFLFKVQDKVVQRMEDYRNLHKDLLSINEVQRFMNVMGDIWKLLPYEYQKLLVDECKKRDIIIFSIEQLIPTNDKQISAGDTSGTPSEAITDAVIIQQDKTVLA
jgi:hypothetical protein